jgi:PAS domain-containing protein
VDNFNIGQTRALSRHEEKNWQGVLNAIPTAAYTCDAAGLITYFNALAEAVWGRKPKLRDPADRYCGSFRMYRGDGTQLPHGECWMALALQAGKPYHGREIVIEQPCGHRVCGFAYAYPMRNHEDQVIGALNLVLNITAQKKLVAEREVHRTLVARHHDAALAMIEVGISALAGMKWANSAFN